MKNTVGVLDDVMNFLSGWKDPNDPDDVMNYDEMDVAISKVASEKLQGKTMNFTWGELVINNTKDLFGDKVYDCVDTKVWQMYLNGLLAALQPQSLLIISVNINTLH